MKIFSLWSVLILAAATSALAGANADRSIGTFERPFAADSCWNTSIPPNARYMDCREQWKKLAVQSPGITTDKNEEQKKEKS